MATDSVIRPVQTGANDRGYRMLPHNLEAEQGLLGALLVDNRALEKVSDFLKPKHFYAPAHQRVYDAISKMTERGQRNVMHDRLARSLLPAAHCATSPRT